MEFRVKEICKEKGMTMEMLAGKVGIHRVNLSASLKGNPTIGTLENIANALEVPITELFAKPVPSDFLALVRDRGETYTFTGRKQLREFAQDLPEE